MKSSLTGSKKNWDLSLNQRRLLVEPEHSRLSISRQCELLGVSRSSYYWQPARESSLNLELMRLIDRQYMETPFYGVPRMTTWLCENHCRVNPKRVARLMSIMGLKATMPGPHTSRSHPHHKVYPYLLRDVAVESVNIVWSTDITYIPMRRGYMYLTAVIDWFSRCVLSWEISNTLEIDFCITALEKALKKGLPHIFNTDQGAQFTSPRFTEVLKKHGVRISMDGRGRALDNVFIERLWRSVKYEDIYLKDYENGHQLHHGLDRYFEFYNEQRPHTSLGDRRPQEVFTCMN